MTNEELEAIKKRAEAATPGPWDASEDSDRSYKLDAPKDAQYWVTIASGNTLVVSWWQQYADDSGTVLKLADAAFIAAARTDVPRLLAEVERLRALVGDHECHCWACACK